MVNWHQSMQQKNPLSCRDTEPIISSEAWASFLTLAAVAILGAVGVLLAGQAAVVPLACLLAIGLAFNLAIFWLERRNGLSRFWEWVAYLGNLALITAGLHLSWGLASPYLPLYAAYIAAGAVRHGRRGALRCVVLSAMSLLALLALGGSLDLEPLARLAINVGMLMLIGIIAGLLGQRRIDAVRSAERRAEELAALNEIGRAISARIEVDRLLEEICRQAGRLMDVSNFYVALLDEATDQLVFPLFYRNGRREKVPPQHHDEGLTGYIVRTRKPLLLANMPKEVADLELDYVGPPCLSWLGVPMIAGERVLGVITVQSYEQPNAFDGGDAKVLQTIADQAAVAVENAQLYQELEEQAEQLHHACKELQARERQRAKFVQDVSHDLRAPLTFITGYVELALKGELGPLTEQQQESLEIVLDKTSLLARMAEDIIMLERPLLDPNTLMPTSLPHLAQAALQGAEATAQAVRITLRAEIPDDIPQVFADPQQLMHVFDNLLSNAIKYSPDESTVILSMRDVSDAIQIAVQDEGIGIPKEAQAHVFERFYQVDSARPRRADSFGLGLAIVKEIVEAHGGKVWVESEIGRGSTFYFTVSKKVDE